MRLLQACVDTTVIALWLGHEQITTTNVYLHADMTIKEDAIAKVTPQGAARPAVTSRPTPSSHFLTVSS